MHSPDGDLSVACLPTVRDSCMGEDAIFATFQMILKRDIDFVYHINITIFLQLQWFVISTGPSSFQLSNYAVHMFDCMAENRQRQRCRVLIKHGTDGGTDHNMITRHCEMMKDVSYVHIHDSMSTQAQTFYELYQRRYLYASVVYPVPVIASANVMKPLTA